MALGLEIPALALVKADDARIREQADPFGSHLIEGLEDVGHHLLAQTISLVEGMHGDVPDGGFKNTIPGAARKTHQTGHPGVVPPEPHFEQAVAERFTHPANRPATRGVT